MITRALIIILLVFNLSLKAQNNVQEIKNKKELSFHYNFGHVGNNFSLNYHHYYGRHAGMIGIKSHDNTLITDNQGFAFKKRGYAFNFNEFTGLNFGYRYDLSQNNEIVIPYFFFQSQISYLRMKHPFERIDFVNNHPTVTIHTSITTPYLVTENVIGFGMIIKLYQNWFFNQSIGAGISTFTNNNVHLIPPPDYNTSTEIGTLISMGITYRLN